MPISTEYYREYTQVNLDADRGRAGRLDFVFDRLGIADADVLDIGCGPGVQFVSHVARNRFTGVDISCEALEEARKRGYKVVQHDVSRTLPFAEGAFDVAIVTDILEHLVEPLALLRETRRVLRPDGLALVSVPNHFFLLNRLRIFSGKGLILPWPNHQEYEDWNYFHLRFFRRSSLNSLLAQAGFSVRDDLSRHFYAPLPRLLEMALVNRAVRALRRYTLQRWPDLWILHLFLVCSPC